MQIDSSLEAFNRIAQTTTFQGRTLLDGSLDFITDGRHELQPASATCRSTRPTWARRAALAVAVDVTTAATQAQVDVTNIPAVDRPPRQRVNLTFTNTATQAQATGHADDRRRGVHARRPLAGGAADGAEGNERDERDDHVTAPVPPTTSYDGSDEHADRRR